MKYPLKSTENVVAVGEKACDISRRVGRYIEDVPEIRDGVDIGPLEGWPTEGEFESMGT